MYSFVIPLMVAIEHLLEDPCLQTRSTFLAMAQHRLGVALVIKKVGGT